VKIHVVSQPAFRAQGTAVRDALNPHKIVLGGDREAVDVVAALYGPDEQDRVLRVPWSLGVSSPVLLRTAVSGGYSSRRWLRGATQEEGPGGMNEATAG
jgi:hypothetical protein